MENDDLKGNLPISQRRFPERESYSTHFPKMGDEGQWVV